MSFGNCLRALPDIVSSPPIQDLQQIGLRAIKNPARHDGTLSGTLATMDPGPVCRGGKIRFPGSVAIAPGL